MLNQSLLPKYQVLLEPNHKILFRTQQQVRSITL